MTLTAADVAEIMRVIEQSKFDELSLEMDGVKLTLRRAGAACVVVQGTTTQADQSNPEAGATANSGEAAARAGGRTRGPAGRAAAPRPAAPASSRAAPAGSGESAANVSDISSPMLGTFYRAPKPGSAPFVEVGSRVEEDSVIAIIEVMKLMNTVRAGVRGVITEILPADESLVEFGDVLMRARTDT